MKQLIEETFLDEARTRIRGGNYLPSEVFAELNRQWPQFSPPPGRFGFNLKAEVGSQVLKDILQFLAENGRTPLWSYARSPGPTEFVLSGKTLFEPADLERARYVNMYPAKDIAKHVVYDAERNLWVVAETIYPKVSMGTLDGGGEIAVDAAMRERMIAQSFQDVQFRPMEIRGESPRAKPLWEILTDRLLPPHLPIMRHADGPPCDPETGAPRPEHEFYSFCPLRWRKSDIDAMGSFDFARTSEYSTMIYVSKRVYEWFDKQRVLERFMPLIEE